MCFKNAASIEYRNMNRDSDRLSASPPPEAQLSLKGRDVLGIIEPLSDKAFAAAAGELKSMKQYPALLFIQLDAISKGGISRLPRKFVSNHLDIDLLTHAEPDRANEVLINPRFELTHPE